MNLISALKSSVLIGADAFNDAVGGPQPFTRSTKRDPAGEFDDDMARRDAIAAAAEAELHAFVRDGVFFAELPNSLGDACIWQGVYTAMCVMRWNVTKTSEDHEAMVDACWALSRYLYPTGAGSSILVRGAVPQSLEHDFFHVDANNNAHYFTDGYLGQTYVYRDDASLDSLLGAMFGAAIVQRFGDVLARSAIAWPLSLFCGGFEASGRRLTNRDGSPTKYGDCSPGIFQAPVRILAGVLPSLLCGCAAARASAQKYAPEFATTDTQIPGKISYVNAHLAILASLSYLAAAKIGDHGYEQVSEGVRRLMDKYADAGNSFLVYAAKCLGVKPTQAQLDKADKVMLEFPIGPKPKMSLSANLPPALQPVPVWQRPPCDVVWQRNPYTSSGSESFAYTRLDYLLSHYFQRSL